MVIIPVGGVKNDAGVVAFDSQTGKEIWKSTSEPASYTPAMPIELDGKRLVVCYMQNCLLVLNREDGSVYLKRKLSQGYDEHSAWPIYDEPNLWLSAPFKAGSYLLDLSQPQKDAVWRSKLLSNDVCSSVLSDGSLYGFDIIDVQSKTHRPSRGIFRCLDFRTGEERWSVGSGRPRRTSNADEFRNDIGQSGIVVVGNKFLILNELGELILLKADSTEPSELCRASVLTGELTWTPPCFNRGRVYIRNQTQAMCLYVGDPAKLGDIKTTSVAELPQRNYYNLAALLLAVEPEYAFDIPSDRWLAQWFAIGSVIICLGCFVANPNAANWQRHADVMFWLFCGCLGTTILGYATREFVFTWPVCLYAALNFSVRQPRDLSGVSRTRQFFYRRTGLLVLVIVSTAYFLICRRLSLVFEWSFLFGLTGTLPVVWVTRQFKTGIWIRCITCLTGFAALFATTAAFLKHRY